MEEVVRLQEHIGKFRVGDTRFRGLEARADAVALDHLVYRKMLSHVAQEFHHRDRAQPVGIVDHLEIIASEKLDELLLQALGIAIDLLVREELALACLAARIAHHAGARSDDDDELVAVLYETAQHEDSLELAHVHGISSRVDPEIERALGTIGDLLERLS